MVAQAGKLTCAVGKTVNVVRQLLSELVVALWSLSHDWMINMPLITTPVLKTTGILTALTNILL